MKALITRKVGMASTISDDGAVLAVTLLAVEPNTVTQVKTAETDGYNALQIGTGKEKKMAKPQVGHYKPAKVMPKIVRECIIKDNEEPLSVGDEIKADVFSVGDTVDVVSTSKGKGWAGTIKRHNFHRGRKTHGGQSYRRPGSIGSMYPQKIFKGKKMAGQMGATRVTVKNLKVALIDLELGVLGVTGAVPGPKKTVVMVRGVKS